MGVSKVWFLKGGPQGGSYNGCLPSVVSPRVVSRWFSVPGGSTELGPPSWFPRAVSPKGALLAGSPEGLERVSSEGCHQMGPPSGSPIGFPKSGPQWMSPMWVLQVGS
jgi:hypothetical protein